MKTLNALSRTATLAFAGTVLAFAASAQQTYPERPVRLIVGVPAGQSTDILTRVLANKVAEYVKQAVVVDNKPGAGGIIALEAAKGAAPDGYTLVMATGSTMAINPALYRKLPYDPVADFEPIVAVLSAPLFLFTSPSTPIASARELPAFVRARGSQVSYGSTGNGGTQHIAMEMLKKMAKLEMTHVPYKGAPPMVTDVIGGQVQFGFDAGASILPLAKDGRVKLLGISSAQRSTTAPEVPTIAEQGFPGFAAVAWAAMYAPKGAPAYVMETMNAAFNRALKDPAVIAELRSRGAEVIGGTPAELRSFQQGEISRWGEAVKASGAKVD